MIRRLMTAVALAVVLAPRLIAETCADCARYEVVLRDEVRDEDAGAAAADLGRITGGEAQAQGNGRVVVTTTSARARVLAADGRVASVRPMSGETAQLHAATSSVESWSSGVAYQYDGAGNIRSIGPNVYVYDTAGRLVSGSVGGAANTQTYAYDSFGNRTDAARVAGAALCTNGTNCEQPVSVDWQTNRLMGTTIAYDQAGNLTAIDGTHSYVFDAMGSMTRQTDNGNTREYVYTADDERLGVYNGGWSWTVRDLGGHVVRELTSTGTLGTANWKWRRDHVFRGALLLASEVKNYDANDQPLPGTITEHFHLDHLGTPRLITGANGVLLAEHAYYPFGGAMQTTPTESPLEALRFTGHERDELSEIHSLDYMRARYYGWGVGRFLSIDPVLGNVHAPQSWNRFSYVSNSPIARLDPMGLFSEGADCQRNLVPNGDCHLRDDTKERDQRSSATVTVTAKDPGWLSAMLYRAALKFVLRRMGHEFTEAEKAAMLGQNYLASYLMRGGKVRRLYGGPVVIGIIGTEVGAAEWFFAAEGETRVTRWMSSLEYEQMRTTGSLQVGAGARTYVTSVGAPKPPGVGPIRVDFNVPSGALEAGGQSDWFFIGSYNRVPVTGIVGP